MVAVMKVTNWGIKLVRKSLGN